MSVDRGFTWMDDETNTLIDIFRRPDVQAELRGAKRNITVFEKIAQELSDIGYSRTAYQCREKIKRLRKEYLHNKYCFENNTIPKRPMKHYELVSKIFNKNLSDYNNITDLTSHSSENEEEIYPSFYMEKESDASNSFMNDEHITPQSILPGPSSLTEFKSETSTLLEVKLSNSPLTTQSNSDSPLFLNGEQNYAISKKDSPLEDMDSPWVPNVVLVENDPIDEDIESTSNNGDNVDENLLNFNNMSEKESSSKDSTELPRKKRKHNMLKDVLDNVTDNFLKYQENAESRFLERITHLERERMKRDENMQKLWLDFEERRRKEEQEHEIKMLSLLGQFVSQFKDQSND